jgi:hypothetical protein
MERESIDVEALRHDAATWPNIPTAEFAMHAHSTTGRKSVEFIENSGTL